MDYEVDTKKAKLSFKSLLLLFASVVVLPYCLLIPFADHSSKLNPVLGFSAIDGSKPGCISSGNLIAHGQCATWLTPRSTWPLTMLLFIVLVGFSVALSVYAYSLSHKDGKHFVNCQFVIALLVSLLSFFVFALMRDASQDHGSYDFGFVTANLAKGGSLSNGGPYVPAAHTALGYGIKPAMALLLITGFLLPTFMVWFQFVFSRKHVNGQRKERLFR